ncbi:ATP-binding cassette domain-containing protein [Viridibacillus sp. FSL R5-0477]|uniref:ABC transporter ATP-binding protein n=1 Tax=Viridibacillus arenosi FSL R5-213 TaxID=1227360 RepID=W4F322_9BACL|nr:ATP-binding cassette domain-containing protein [Viridibacillus arenosi]ETT86441.1 ABC transporter ATP-binding protein [Viridibacillus arenosi FSL R5-213]OMC91724.1 ABC transporter ATP-binding protein [Viridibacillus arenosi]
MTENILIKNMTFKYLSMLKPIFKNVNLNINENWKLGLVGRNGRGKTTFLKILLNQLEYKGSIQSILDFKYFPSFPDTHKNLTALEVLLKQNPHIDIWQIERELTYMDISHDILDKSFNVLSGGEQTKLLLIELFLNENSFPLIDEPTNNLDLHGRKIVSQYLEKKKGFIVISHDESFLNQFVDHVLAINKESIDMIRGNVDTWKYEKANADMLSEEKNAKLKTEINRLNDVSKQMSTWGQKRENSTKDASARRLAAKQMKRAKAVKKRTEVMIEEKESLLHNIENVSELKMRVKQPIKQVLFFRDFSILRNGIPLFEPINIDVYPTERFFIEGENGVGKSTLLNFILGIEQLETIGEYRISLPHPLSILSQKNKVDIDYFSVLNQLPTKEAKEEYWHLLYQLGIERSSFSDKSSENWSAGEQKKVFLANALLGENELFIWDEVTNYLDMFVINQLIDSIKKYQPTMIAVDHNEYFVNAIATKKIELKSF